MPLALQMRIIHRTDSMMNRIKKIYVEFEFNTANFNIEKKIFGSAINKALQSNQVRDVSHFDKMVVADKKKN